MTPAEQARINFLIDGIFKFHNALTGHEFYAYQLVFARRIIESILLNDGATITGLWSRQCLAGDTMILDQDGSTWRIKDHPRAWITGFRTTYRVEAQTGYTVLATANHPFFTKRGWVPVGDLVPTDEIAVLKSWATSPMACAIFNTEAVSWSNVKETPCKMPLSDGEELVFVQLRRVVPCTKETVYDIEYPNKGWFIANGFVVHNSGKTTAVAELIITLAVILPVLAHALNPFKIDPRTGQTTDERDKQAPELIPFLDGLRVGIFAPIEHQSQLSYTKMRAIIHSDRAHEILEEEDINVNIETSRGDTLTLSNGSVIWARTASPNSKIEGETFHIILLDESQDLDRFKVEKEIEPMRAATFGTMVKIGTANVSRGGFHRDIEENIERHRLKLGPRNHFQFDYLVVVRERRAMYERTGDKSHLRYEKYVEQQRRRLGGEKSLAFRLNFLLKWQESQKDAISARALLQAPDPRRELNVIHVEDVDSTSMWVRVGGQDIAKENDFSISTAMEYDVAHPVTVKDEKSGDLIRYYPKRVVGLLSLQGYFEDTPEGEGQYTKIVQFFRNWLIGRVVVDATGMGDPVWERLSTLAPEIEWEPFKFSGPTKSNLYRHYIDEWEAGRIKIAAGGKSKDTLEYIGFIEEHRNLEKTSRGQLIECHAPKPKNNRTPDEEQYNDDYCDSGALAAWAVKTALLQEVRVDMPPGRTHTRRGSRPSVSVPVSPDGHRVSVPTGAGLRHRYRRRW